MGSRWTFRDVQLAVNGQCEQLLQRATARREKLGSFNVIPSSAVVRPANSPLPTCRILHRELRKTPPLPIHQRTISPLDQPFSPLSHSPPTEFLSSRTSKSNSDSPLRSLNLSAPHPDFPLPASCQLQPDAATHSLPTSSFPRDARPAPIPDPESPTNFLYVSPSIFPLELF